MSLPRPDTAIILPSCLIRSQRASKELREKLAEAQSDTGAQKEALELKVEIYAVLNGINKLLDRLDKVQDGKRGAGVCKALVSALTQSQNQITKRLEKFEREA